MRTSSPSHRSSWSAAPWGTGTAGKRVFLIGLAIFTAMSAACALSPNESVLIAARAAQGVGAALVAPLSLSILADAYPPERRTAAIGIWAAAAGLGFGAGPVVGGILVELFSWSAVFWVNVPIGIIGLVLVITGVRESRNPHARRLDLGRCRARRRAVCAS